MLSVRRHSWSYLADRTHAPVVGSGLPKLLAEEDCWDEGWRGPAPEEAGEDEDACVADAVFGREGADCCCGSDVLRANAARRMKRNSQTFLDNDGGVARLLGVPAEAPADGACTAFLSSGAVETTDSG